MTTQQKLEQQYPRHNIARLGSYAYLGNVKVGRMIIAKHYGQKGGCFVVFGKETRAERAKAQQ